MKKQLFPTGEFARLARTTTRTIHYYDKKGLLKPVRVNDKGYRFYDPRQIVDFQAIHLLRRLDFSIEEIKSFLKKSKTLKDLFEARRNLIRREIRQLRLRLKNVDSYYKNLDDIGLLARPKLKTVNPFEIYYIQRETSYPGICDACFELKAMFSKVPKNAVYLTIFDEPEYKPKKCKMKIGLIKDKRIKVKKMYRDEVKQMRIPKYKTLYHFHYGSGRLLSLLYDSLFAYQCQKGFKVDRRIANDCLELYHRTSLNGVKDEDEHIFEMQVPVR